MRFGKKLALQVMEDQSGAPYLSHKPMKEAINKTVRELRLYQAKLQGTDQTWGACSFQQLAAPGEEDMSLDELEESVAQLDKELFDLVDKDLDRILAHIRLGEAQLGTELAALQSAAVDAGVLVEEATLQRLEKTLPNVATDRAALCRHLMDLRVTSDLWGVARHLETIGSQYDDLVENVNQHSQYF